MSNRRPAKCRTQKIGKVNVIKLIGRLTPDEHDDLLITSVTQLINSGEKDFLIDLSAVNYINSTGIGSLIQSYRLAEGCEGRLKLLNPSQSVTQIIMVSKLDSIFEVFRDQDVALASFVELPPPPPPPLPPPVVAAPEVAKRGRPRKNPDHTKGEE